MFQLSKVRHDVNIDCFCNRPFEVPLQLSTLMSVFMLKSGDKGGHQTFELPVFHKLNVLRHGYRDNDVITG